MAERTSKEVAADVYRLLVSTCASYQERRKEPPYPAFDMADYMHVCWDFAAHAVDLVKAGRAEELRTTFAALEPFHASATESWLRSGPTVIFERLLSDGERQNLAEEVARTLPPLLTDDQRQLFERIRVPDDHPYPIDGFW